MPSSTSYLRFKQRLTQKDNHYFILFLVFFFMLGIVLGGFGLKELYKLNTFHIHQCQVKSIDFKFENRNLYPRWNITAIHQNQTIEGSLVSSDGFSTESDAWDDAHKYKINKTYICYHSRNETSLYKWTWQWNKPSLFEAYAGLFSGVLVILIFTGLVILRRVYQIEFRNAEQQQQQIQLSSIRNEEQHQEILFPYNPPPDYNEVAQQTLRQDTRI